MKVIFKEKETITLRFDVDYVEKMSKQHIADYLMGKYDQGTIYCTALINERQILMAYLPFVHTIGFYDPEMKLTRNQIKLVFEGSTLANPSPVILEVSDELYKFLCDI